MFHTFVHISAKKMIADVRKYFTTENNFEQRVSQLNFRRHPEPDSESGLHLP